MGDAPHDTAEQPWRTALDSVERQVERGSLFTHTALSETAERVTEVETFLYGLVDVLVASQVIDQDALGQAAAAVRGELDQRAETMSPGVALRVDTEIPPTFSCRSTALSGCTSATPSAAGCTSPSAPLKSKPAP